MPEITPEAPAPVSEAAIPAADSVPAAAPAVVETDPAPAPAPDASAPAPAAEPAPKGEAPEERELTLLEKFDAKKAEKDAPPAKPEETEKPEEKAAEAEKAPETEEKAEKAPEPEKPAPVEHVWDELTLPEGFAKRFDLPEAEVAKRIGEFNEIITKDANPNVKRAELLALHTKAMQEFADQVQQQQAIAWKKYNQSQVLATMGDSELGGAGHETAMGAVARVRDAVTKEWSKGQRQELNDFLIATGAGSHPAFLRLLHSAASFIDEPQIPNFTPAPTKETGLRETGKGGRKSSVLYDNPRSA